MRKLADVPASVVVSIRRILPLLVLALFLAYSLSAGRAQMANDAYATKYFLDQPPSTAEMSRLPSDARDVIVAKVRIIGKVGYLIGRDQSGGPPSHPLPKDLYAAWVELTGIIRGAGTPGVRVDVSFGRPGTLERYIVPLTPRQSAREYFIVSYVANDGVRRLIGSPVSREAYERWSTEVREYERARGQPRTKDN